jgi:hypothetical protein
MRAHGRAAINPQSPRALGVCDRCGALYNHHELQPQYQWAGPQLQNLRILVCRDCLDVPQMQLRTVILPADPLPIDNPRPENYVADNNPISPIGQNADPRLPAGSNIGTLIGCGGTYAAFDSNANKPSAFSAALTVSVSSYGNWVGKNWAADPSGALTPDGLTPSTLSYTVSGFEATAPNDQAFLGSSYATTYAFRGSSDGSTWTTLTTGVTAGTVGEVITVTGLGGTAYQYHQYDLVGDGVNNVAIAQLTISVSDSGRNA